MELEYCYNGIVWMIVWGPNKDIDKGSSLSMEGSDRQVFAIYDDVWFVLRVSHLSNLYGMR